MHNRHRTGLQHTTISPRKSLLWLIAPALLLSAIITLLLTTPTLASPTQPASHGLTCQAGQIADAQGQCVTAPSLSGPSSFTPGNKQIQNPIANQSPLLFFTSLDYTVNQPQVQALWRVSLWIVDICLALALVLNGITIMLGGSFFPSAKIIESLPGVLIALIAAHASMLFVSIFLTMNNVLSTDLFNWADNQQNFVHGQVTIHAELHDCILQISAGTSDNSPITCTRADGSKFNLTLGDLKKLLPDAQGNPQDPSQTKLCHDSGDGQTFSNYDCHTTQSFKMSDFTITPKNLDLGGINITDKLKTLGGALDLLLTVTSLMLIAQVIIRFFYLDLYIVLAPIGIACWALPGRAGQPMTRSWFKGFLSTVFVQFIQVMAIIVTEALLMGLLGFLVDPNQGGITDSILPAGQLVKLMNEALVWFIFRVPLLLNVAPMRGMVEVGEAITQAANTVISTHIMQSQEDNMRNLGIGTTVGGTAAGLGTQILTQTLAR